MHTQGLKTHLPSNGSFPARQHGAALVEYAIVTFLFVLALVAGPNVIHQLSAALVQAYQSFVFVLSAP
ncbi:MAG: hypothetical protein ACYC3A_11370 [Halothiobacillus sp.]